MVRADNGIRGCGDNGKGIKLCVGVGVCPGVEEPCQRHDVFVFPAEAVPGMRRFGKMFFIRLKKMGQCTMEVWKLSPCWSNLSLSSPFATPTEKGTSWTSILISIKLNNSVTIPTAMSMARSARTISGLIVVYTIKCIAMLANRFGSLPKEPSSTI